MKETTLQGFKTFLHPVLTALGGPRNLKGTKEINKHRAGQEQIKGIGDKNLANWLIHERNARARALCVLGAVWFGVAGVGVVQALGP